MAFPKAKAPKGGEYDQSKLYSIHSQVTGGTRHKLELENNFIQIELKIYAYKIFYSSNMATSTSPKICCRSYS